MALNFSYRPIFPAHLSEENSVSPMSISGVPERNSDVYGMSWLINRELENCLDFLEDTCEGGGSRDCVPGDVLDLLPSDPFGMDMSTTFTAITGWLDDLNVDYGGDGGGYGRDERVLVDESNQLFAGLNYIWNNAFRLQSFPHGNEGIVHGSGERGGFSEWSDGRKVGGLSCHTDPQSSYVVDTIQTLGIEPEISGGGFVSWSDERNAGGLSCHTDLESPYVVDTIQTLGIEPEISGGGFGAWSDGRISFHTDLESPRHVVDTIQTFSIEPEISGGGFGAWSDGRTAGYVSFHTDLESPRHVVDTIQSLGIEAEISGGGFSAWSDGITAGCVSFCTDLESPRHVVDTIQTYSIEPEISGRGFGAWSDGRTAGCVSLRTDLESSRHAVDTIQTFSIEPEISGGGFGAWSDGRRAGGVSCHTDPESPPYSLDIIRTFSIEPEISEVQPVVLQEGNCVSSDLGEPPHTALNFVLGYLGTRELLVIESVCKSLQSTAEDDPFFWRNINICGKVDVKITDDILLKLTSKAQGGLESLSLVNCVMISDNGLNEVLLNNPKVTKLSVPGCTRLTIGGIVDSLKAFKSIGRPGLKHLSIAGMYGVTEAHFKELEKLLLGTDNLTQLNTHEPRFYRGGIHFPLCNDGRAIDIERCPKCMNMRIVYDCPVVGCKGIKEGDTDPNANAQRCRGCTLCIARCNWCGRCIDETVHEETFSLDLRCIDCGKKISG
ncbi:F-box protein SKIP14-like isoform X2 [Cucurbita maxima]|uniref:F-box protein SKIP14-like isoform X2 n=1 Tax=Cucurbita maxima TaxID=3661 RepID=A0A6J1HU71_CUCMA|nr:F-box protein SKIP14-like isoform X2 [Cucurbita maxima]